jgi:hypothetical protein
MNKPASLPIADDGDGDGDGNGALVIADSINQDTIQRFLF